MLKEKIYINCIRFYSTSNPCPNGNNEYIKAAKRSMPSGTPIPQNGGDLNQAKEICRNCESFELIEK